MKIVFAPLSNFFSHRSRLLCIADEMKKRGHQAEFICSTEAADAIGKAGYKTNTAPEVERSVMFQMGTPRSYLTRYRNSNPAMNDKSQTKYRLKEMIDADFRIYDEVKPDLIIADGRPVSRICAWFMDIPCMEVRNIAGYIGAAQFMKSSLDREIECDHTVEMEMSQEFGLDFLNLAIKYRKNPQAQPDIPCIVPGIPEFELPNNNKLLEKIQHTLTGPLSWNGWNNSPEPVKESYKGKKVILVSMGSSFPFPSIIDRIVQAFSGNQYKVIINTGNNMELTQSLPENCDVLPFISLPRYLQIADFVIHHGGHGTMMEILAAGKPSLAIPFNGDQMEVSRQVEALNLGKRIKKYPDDITEKEIIESVSEVETDTRIKENLMQFQALMEKSGNSGAGMASDFIEKTVRQTVLTH